MILTFGAEVMSWQVIDDRHAFILGRDSVTVKTWKNDAERMVFYG